MGCRWPTDSQMIWLQMLCIAVLVECGHLLLTA
jgi:hypothetical protein